MALVLFFVFGNGSGCFCDKKHRGKSSSGYLLSDLVNLDPFLMLLMSLKP